MLTGFGFRRKMVYLCTSKEESALNKRVFSSFFWRKNGVFTSEINFFTLLRKIFLGVCGFFLRHVGGFFGDLGGRKLKDIYFFSCIFLLLGRERMLEDGRGWERMLEEWERMGEDARGWERMHYFSHPPRSVSRKFVISRGGRSPTVFSSRFGEEARRLEPPLPTTSL